MKKLLFAAILILGLTSAASAAPTVRTPMLSWSRLCISTQIEREVLRDRDEQKAWQIAVPAEYLIYSPKCAGLRTSLLLRASQSFDTDERPELFVGVKMELLKATAYAK